MHNRLLFGLVVIALAGCTAKLTGDITLDGQPFELSGCRSGQPSGFAGVDLVGKDGRRLRLVAQPDGSSHAYLLADGTPTDLGPCGGLTIETQNSTVNDVRNVKGTATLSCNAGGHQVGGRVTFENCH
jgi:hypothetical protein